MTERREISAEEDTAMMRVGASRIVEQSIIKFEICKLQLEK
ncbi:unnamed protein product [Arabidopsis halleri]